MGNSTTRANAPADSVTDTTLRYTLANGQTTAHALRIMPTGLPRREAHCNLYSFWGVYSGDGQPIDDFRSPLRRVCKLCAGKVARRNEVLVPWDHAWEPTLDQEWRDDEARSRGAVPPSARAVREDEVARHVAAIADLQSQFDDQWDRYVVKAEYIRSIVDPKIRSDVQWANSKRETNERLDDDVADLEEFAPGVTRQIRMRARVEELLDIPDEQFERWLSMAGDD